MEYYWFNRSLCRRVRGARSTCDIVLRRGNESRIAVLARGGLEQLIPLIWPRPLRRCCSQRRSRGVNVWLLTVQGYTSPYWATIRQINELGGSVRKGEKATPVVFWRVYVGGVEVKAGEPEAQAPLTEGQSERRFVLRYFSVFNTEQCDLPVSVTERLALPKQRQLDPIEACEKILANMPDPPEIVHAGDKAFYSPAIDRVTIPPRSLFESAEEYWCTLWHEAGGHATGHPKRLNRDSIKDVAPFGSPVYSIEELLADLSAAYLCE